MGWTRAARSASTSATAGRWSWPSTTGCCRRPSRSNRWRRSTPTPSCATGSSRASPIRACPARSIRSSSSPRTASCTGTTSRCASTSWPASSARPRPSIGAYRGAVPGRRPGRDGRGLGTTARAASTNGRHGAAITGSPAGAPAAAASPTPSWKAAAPARPGAPGRRGRRGDRARRTPATRWPGPLGGARRLCRRRHRSDVAGGLRVDAGSGRPRRPTRRRTFSRSWRPSAGACRCSRRVPGSGSRPIASRPRRDPAPRHAMPRGARWRRDPALEQRSGRRPAAVASRRRS